MSLSDLGTMILLGCFAYAVYRLNVWMRARRGETGEALVAGILSQIPDTAIFTNISVGNAEGRAKIDILAIRDNGIFAIEVKNYKGTLWVTDDREWVKKTWSSGGNRYSKKLRNPIHQLRRNVSLFKEGLAALDEPIVPMVSPIICFADDSVRLIIKKEQAVPLVLLHQIQNLILNYPREPKRFQDEAERLKRHLTALRASGAQEAVPGDSPAG